MHMQLRRSQDWMHNMMGVISVWIATEALIGMDYLGRECGAVSRTMNNLGKYYMYYSR